MLENPKDFYILVATEVWISYNNRDNHPRPLESKWSHNYGTLMCLVTLRLSQNNSNNAFARFVTTQVHVREITTQIPHARAIYRAEGIASGSLANTEFEAIRKKQRCSGQPAVTRTMLDLYVRYIDRSASNFLVVCCQVASKSLSAFWPNDYRADRVQ